MSIPVIILSHRKREFIEACIASLKENATGIGPITVVDDSGDADHHRWLESHIDRYCLSDNRGRNVGYLQAMNVVWEAAQRLTDEARVDYVLLWEEDFLLRRKVNVDDMVCVMEGSPWLAQLNLQRQAVYRVERRFGYMESHHRRGYKLEWVPDRPHGIPWVQRQRPFTTNPGLLNTAVLDVDWPTRAECDATPGGAEPAMSESLEARGWKFGWLGQWNTPYVKHVGIEMKTGKGY